MKKESEVNKKPETNAAEVFAKLSSEISSAELACDVMPIEMETLQSVLIATLPATPCDQMTAVAEECAKAVRLAFEELGRSGTSV